jgi:hypothetical protein
MAERESFGELTCGVRSGEVQAARELIQRYEPIRREGRPRLDPTLRPLLDSMVLCRSVLGSSFARAPAGQRTDTGVSRRPASADTVVSRHRTPSSADTRHRRQPKLVSAPGSNKLPARMAAVLLWCPEFVTIIHIDCATADFVTW